MTFNLEYTQSHLYAGAAPPQPPSRRSTASRNPSGRGNMLSGGSTTSSGAAVDARFLSGLGVGLAASPSGTAHLDAVVDLGILRVPYPLIVSGGRDGLIKVWK